MATEKELMAKKVELNAKQDKLIAGAGININQQTNVISATGGGSTEVIVNPLINTGTKIATITVDDTIRDIYAPGSDISILPTLDEGTLIGTITVDNVDYLLYAPDNTGASVYVGTTLPPAALGQNTDLYYQYIEDSSEVITVNAAFVKIEGDWVRVSSGGGSSVEPNPSGTPTDTLNTVGINGVIYDIAGGGGVPDTPNIERVLISTATSANDTYTFTEDGIYAVILTGAGSTYDNTLTCTGTTLHSFNPSDLGSRGCQVNFYSVAADDTLAYSYAFSGGTPSSCLFAIYKLNYVETISDISERCGADATYETSYTPDHNGWFFLIQSEIGRDRTMTRATPTYIQDYATENSTTLCTTLVVGESQITARDYTYMWGLTTVCLYELIPTTSVKKPFKALTETEYNNLPSSEKQDSDIVYFVNTPNKVMYQNIEYGNTRGNHNYIEDTEPSTELGIDGDVYYKVGGTGTITTFSYLMMRITGRRGSGNYTQLSEVEFVDSDNNKYNWSGTTIAHNVRDTGEVPSNLIDGNLNSKCCMIATPSTESPIEITFTLGTLIDLSIYNVWKWYTGNDATERDPTSFELLGSNDGTTWTSLDSAENADIPTTRASLAYSKEIVFEGKKIVEGYIKIDGQWLKYNSGGGGSTDAEEMTYAEYQALTQDEKEDGRIRFITDYPGGGGGGGGSSVDYSTTEQEIGTWIDGKTLYRKSYVLTASNLNNSPYEFDLLVSELDDVWIDPTGTFIKTSDSSGAYTTAVGYWNPANNFDCRLNTGSTKLQLQTWHSGGMNYQDGSVITLNYTKATD